MGFNFPNSPSQGQTYTPVGGYQYVFLDGVWRVVEAPQLMATAQSRNRIVNGAMQISQENNDTSSGTTEYYAADQWVSGVAGLTLSFGRSALPNTVPVIGSRRLGVNFTTGKPALAAGDYFQLFQEIEGNRIADFNWGTANARQVIVRFWAMTTTTPGTYTLGVRNYPATRSYLAAFTLAAINTWTEVVIVMPGDTSGTWATDNTLGAQVHVCFAGGTTFQGVPGWQSGNLLALSGATNGAATSSNVFYVGGFGLYLDPQATGIAPAWQMPDEAEELRACQRYWEAGQARWDGTASAAIQASTPVVFKVNKRSTPAMSGTSTAASLFPATPGYGAITQSYGISVRVGTAAGAGFFSDNWIANSRM